MIHRSADGLYGVAEVVGLVGLEEERTTAIAARLREIARAAREVGDEIARLQPVSPE
jgi:hypothetical protein